MRSSFVLLAVALVGCPARDRLSISEAAPLPVDPEPRPRVPESTQLTLVKGARHPNAAAVELQTGELPVVLVGHGLTLALQPPAIAVNANGTLLVGRRDGNSLVLRAVIAPGTAAATQSPTSVDGRTFSTGADGPVIQLEPQVASLKDAILESGTVVSGPDWRVIAQDAASVPLIAGMSVRTEAEGGAALWVLAPGTSIEERIELNGPYPRAPQPTQLLFPGAFLEGSGESDGIIWHSLSYQAEGVSWRQRFYVLAMDGGAVMLLKVQARASAAETAFGLADRTVGGFRQPQPD